MRSPTRLMAALMTVTGAGMMAVGSAAHADTTIALSSCTSWSITSNASFVCVTGQSTNPNAPTNCTVNSSALNNQTYALSSGVSDFSFAASCASNTTQWAWTRGGAPVSTQEVSINGSSATYHPTGITASTTFVATPWNGTPSAPGSVAGTPFTISVNTAGSTPSNPGTPPSTGTDAGGPSLAKCNALGFTNIRQLSMPWPGLGSAMPNVYSAQAGGFGPKDVVVVSFTPEGVSNAVGSLSIAEYVDAPATRTAVIGNSPCDFGQGITNDVTSQTALLYFTSGGSLYAQLTPGKTYYLSIRNDDCTSRCDIVVGLKKPKGL